MTPAKRLAKRKSAERRFRFFGYAAIGVSFIALIVLMTSLITQGYYGFLRTEVKLTVTLTPGVEGYTLIREALKKRFPGVTERRDVKELNALVSTDADRLLPPIDQFAGQEVSYWLPASPLTDAFAKGKIQLETPEAQRGATDQQMTWLQILQDQGELRTGFNTLFLTTGDSRQAEQAGFMGSLVGSLLSLIVCMAVSFPLGVMTAVYLEEFAPRNRFIELLEVNINNLAAIPSIIYGLLGLSLYLNLLNMPRSAPVVGGLTLALLILPVVIISTRVAISAVPSSIRDAALAMGASPLQTVWHHVLPLSLPGIMTGTILGIARAIGETAPLLMIGMVAFVSDIPRSFTDPATAMPVQIYLWASNPETAFVEKTAAGILVLLAVLVALNALAIYIRKRFEVRW